MPVHVYVQAPQQKAVAGLAHPEELFSSAHMTGSHPDHNSGANSSFSDETGREGRSF